MSAPRKKRPAVPKPGHPPRRRKISKRAKAGSRATPRRRRTKRHSPEETWARLLEERDRLAPQFPDMDPGDMLLILERLLAIEEGRWDFPIFLREDRPGVYAF